MSVLTTKKNNITGNVFTKVNERLLTTINEMFRASSPIKKLSNRQLIDNMKEALKLTETNPTQKYLMFMTVQNLAGEYITRIIEKDSGDFSWEEDKNKEEENSFELNSY